MREIKSLIPIHWAGQEKVPGIFSCFACPDPQVCADEGKCGYATAEDFERGQRSLGAVNYHG